MKRTLLLIALFISTAVHGADEPRAWHNEPGYRWAALKPESTGQVGFSKLNSEQTGIHFTNRLAEASIAANRVLPNGSGVAVGDFDNDGWPDIYFCGLESDNVLYRNLGHWRFKDVTTEAGVGLSGKICRGAVFADVNGDGFLDLLVSTLSEGVICFVNDGHGKFTDQTSAAGTRSTLASMTLALADVDGNGTLDLYVANNRPDDIRDRGRLSVPVVNGQPSLPAQFKDRLTVRDGQLLEFGQPDQLLLNDGAGRFRAASWTNGTFLDEAGKNLTMAPLDWGLSATFRDVNNDSAPDLYVCNDYWTPDRFWINDARGHFRAIDKVAVRQISSSSMGADFADIDRDGSLDLFVVDMLSRDARSRKRQAWAEKPLASPLGAIDNRPQVMRNTFFRNRGDGTFAEMAYFAGLAASDWSWSPIFVDVDLDGYEDLLISAGHFRDVQDMDAAREIRARQHPWTGFKDDAERQKAYTRELMEHYRLYPSLEMPIVTFRNEHAATFKETTASWGLDSRGIHHGMALGDFDQDGDLDLVVNNLNSLAGIYRNDSTAARVAVKLRGTAPNSQAIGAKVLLADGALPQQTLEVISGGHYLSGSETLCVFAAGVAKTGMRIEVRWRNGTTNTIKGVEADRVYEIDESTSSSNATQPLATAVSQAKSENRSPIFKDVSDILGHTHVEPEYNDFERQPLLPFKLSQSGPGVAWFDCNGDGSDDLIIGSGNGQLPAVYFSDGRGKFLRAEASATPALPSDFSGLLGWIDENGSRELLAGLTGYEAPAKHVATQFRFANGRVESAGTFASEMTGSGALALGDLNGDGQLALFIAGGVSPGHYPLGAPSKIYRRLSGAWKLDARNSQLLANIGIVNGAVWSDLTGDGLPELVLACEWGPIRVFQNRGGLLFDVTEQFGLGNSTGWWKGVAAGDLDGDGKLDIVAGNWGLNSPYQASEKRPLTFFYGELAQPGVTEVIEAEYDVTSGAIMPRRQLSALANSMPFLLEQFTSHRAYSEATLEQVLGERRVLARQVQATTLASMAFLNRGNHFEPVTLPDEAQLAPAFGISIADLDGDGHEDVFLSQNFFAMQPEMSRLDAGRGLCLRGNGHGQLTALPASRSGIMIYGEQRGAALGDFNRDGRIDIVVAQNSAATKLFENVEAPPGLRIALQGSPGNPSGIGAVIWLQAGNKKGPAHEVHAGSGYWSQDSSTQIISSSEKPDSVWIRWPGGSLTTTPIPEHAKELTIDRQGKLVSQR